MIIDFHVHLFPPEVRQDRRAWFTGEPAFELLYASPKATLVGAKDLLAAMDRDGVDRSVVFGFPWRSIERCRRHNDFILEAVARHPRRLVGFGCVHLHHPGAAAEAARCLEAGLSGIGELACYDSGWGPEELARLAPVMEVCRAADVPVLLHTNEPVGHAYPGKTPNTLAEIYALARRFPGNRIVLAHWGGGLFVYHLLRKEAAEVLANVHYDTAASPYLYDARIWKAAADTAGADRILLGSDFPLLPAGRYLDQIRRSPLTPEAQAAVCGGNAARLLKL
jgi:predicted TIM-barrel fold metal-dependent hydrolase